MAEDYDTLTKLKAWFVTRDEFAPVKSIAFGLVGLILVAFVGAVISLIIK